MPQVGKEALSQFIRTECLRLLRLNLSPDAQAFQQERTAAGMPPVQPPRPGLEYLAQAGEEWQAEKIADLSDTFGTAVVIGDRYTNQAGQERFREIELVNHLTTAPQGSFLVESQFDVGPTFEGALGIAGYRQAYGLNYSRLRPDLIEVLPHTSNIDRYVTPAGAVLWLAVDDHRIKLRVIDIKLTAEPSPSYFAEVTYYSMALAGWLADQGLDNRYVVVPDAAIWPGSHDASCLVRTCREIEDQGGTPTYVQMWDAMQEDLEAVPFEVFVGRVKHFFMADLPRAFACPWQQHPWHVDNRCKGCDYLGYPWIDRNGQPTAHPLHCMPTAAQTDHLSRVAFISRGASAALSDQGISDVPALAQLQPNSAVFNAHYSLRATRNVVAGRASSLQAQQSAIPPQSGTSGVMPKYTDLHIYLSVDFDLGSAITFSLGVKGFWVEPQPFGFVGQRANHPYGPHTHVIDQKALPVERRELLAFLNNINAILTDARNRNTDTTVQFYIWDSVQYKYLTRIIGRHLQAILADQTIQHLAWLFPPEELLPNAAMETRRSPITIVREVVRTLLAAPIPHYYTLFHTARVYHQASLPQQVAAFSVHPLFEDTLSDQIPSERAHEIWARVTRPRLWSDQLVTLRETVTKQLGALEAITRRLEEDLRPTLQQIAPQIRIEPPQRQSGISFDGQLWYGFARLNAALGELEVHQIRAMPPEEREARYRSARLTRRLTGAEEATALAQLGIAALPRMRVYEMRPESREVKAREGDFSFALAPENMPGFLDRSLQVVTQGTPLEPPNGSGWRTYMETATGVRIVGIDRDAGLIAVLPNNRYATMLDDLERQGLADFSQDVVLDPVWVDTFTKKLRETLHAIGNPPNALSNALVRRAVGLTTRRSGRQTPGSPAADLLWSGNTLANTAVARNLPGIRQQLEQNGISLNQSQWAAWEASLSHRIQTVWGPPGTGKSRTLRAVVVGAVVDAVQRNIPLRLLACAPTYNALDNVLLESVADISRIAQHPDLQCVRIRSSYRPFDPNIPAGLDLELTKWNPSIAVQQLRQRRQTIGRGLRLCVNQNGERLRGFEINTLTVVAMESYEEFAENLQREIEEDTGIRFGIVEKHQFAAVTMIGADGKVTPLGFEKSEALWNHLKTQGMIDARGKVQDVLKQALKDGTLALPAEFQAQKEQIAQTLKKLAGRLEIKNADERRQVRVRKEVYLSEEFKALWDSIKHKTTYRVNFDNEKLVESCCKALRDAPAIPKSRLQWRKADIAIGKAGVEATECEGAATVVLDEGDIDLPDLLTDLQDRTQLTRRTIHRILIGSRRLDDIKRNPQEFIDLVAEAVNRCKRLAIVDGIKYQRLGDAQYYAQELFEQEELTGYLKNLLDARKSVYEQVVFDSDTEAAFADQLEKNTAIKVYAKLPGWFTVPTPLGGYNPDWAVLVEEEGQERLYFVVETKGTMLFADALRPTEQAKIDCAREHFEALGTRTAFTVANTFETFAERYTTALADKKPIESEAQNRQGTE